MGPKPASAPTDTLSSPSPAPRPSTHTQPLTTNDVDIGLAATLQSNVATGASLLPALNITNGPSTRSKSMGRTRARELTTSPQAMTQGDEERVQTVPKPMTKKQRVNTQAEPITGPSKKAMGKQRQPDSPLPPPQPLLRARVPFRKSPPQSETKFPRSPSAVHGKTRAASAPSISMNPPAQSLLDRLQLHQSAIAHPFLPWDHQHSTHPPRPIACDQHHYW